MDNKELVLKKMDSDGVLDFIVKMEQYNNLKEVQETLTRLFSRYKALKQELVDIKEEIRSVLEGGVEQESVAKELISEIFENEKK